MGFFLRYRVGAYVDRIHILLWGKIEPDLENTNQTAGDGGNGMGTVFAPMGYVSHQLDEKWTVGFGAYGGFGDELEYKNDWAGRYMIQKDTPGCLQPWGCKHPFGASSLHRVL